MINLQEINAEITKLENCDYTNYKVCEKLAILYTVREHFGKTSSNTAMIRSNGAMSSPTMMT